MLDVIHYLFEDDLVTTSSEQAKARSRVRKNIYRDWYDVDYKFGVSEDGASGASSATGGTGTSIVPMDGRATAGPPELIHKPYIPPTDVDIGPDPSRPFKGLDSPLG